jgi:hypothetical protein
MRRTCARSTPLESTSGIGKSVGAVALTGSLYQRSGPRGSPTEVLNCSARVRQSFSRMSGGDDRAFECQRCGALLTIA